MILLWILKIIFSNVFYMLVKIYIKLKKVSSKLDKKKYIFIITFFFLTNFSYFLERDVTITRNNLNWMKKLDICSFVQRTTFYFQSEMKALKNDVLILNFLITIYSKIFPIFIHEKSIIFLLKLQFPVFSFVIHFQYFFYFGYFCVV